MSNKRNVVSHVDAELVKKTKDLGFNLGKTFENHTKHLLTQFSALNTANNIETIVEFGSQGEIQTLAKHVLVYSY
jgi:hypothetical protein